MHSEDSAGLRSFLRLPFHNRGNAPGYSFWDEIRIGWELRTNGAYEPRWFMYRMHMNPEEAVRAHLDLHSENSLGIHFGLIDNAGESYDAPVNDLIAARQAHGVEATRFVAPAYGQVFRY